MTTPLQKAFPDVDIIEGVTEFVVDVEGTDHGYKKGDILTISFDDNSAMPFFKCQKRNICGQYVRLDNIKLKENKMTKTVKVENGKFEIPAGHEIDTVTFKKSVNNRPRSWDEYEAINPTLDPLAYFDSAPEEYRALRKLQLMRDMWVGNWVADYADGNWDKYTILYESEIMKVHNGQRCRRNMSFPTRKMAEDFIEAH